MLGFGAVIRRSSGCGSGGGRQLQEIAHLLLQPLRIVPHQEMITALAEFDADIGKARVLLLDRRKGRRLGPPKRRSWPSCRARAWALGCRPAPAADRWSSARTWPRRWCGDHWPRPTARAWRCARTGWTSWRRHADLRLIAGLVGRQHAGRRPSAIGHAFSRGSRIARAAEERQGIDDDHVAKAIGRLDRQLKAKYATETVTDHVGMLEPGVDDIGEQTVAHVLQPMLVRRRWLAGKTWQLRPYGTAPPAAAPRKSPATPRRTNSGPESSAAAGLRRPPRRAAPGM